MAIDSELLGPQIAATILHVKVGALAHWRYKGIGPEFVRLNRSIYYPARSLAAFLRALPVGGFKPEAG